MSDNWALIAGGSEGIGLAFARQLAARGNDLILVAHDQPSLDAATAELAERVEVLPVLADLTDDDALDRLMAAIGDRTVDVLVANAALSPIGEFLDVEEDLVARTLRLNVEVPTLLAHRLGASMRDRGRGTIIVMSSLSGLQGTALLTTYAATKSYLRVLAEGLWEELGRHGVNVVGVLPGTTDTPGFRSSAARGGPKPMPPAQVAEEVLSHVADGPVVVPGRANRATAFLTTRVLSRRRAIRLIGSVTRKMYRRG